MDNIAEEVQALEIAALMLNIIIALKENSVPRPKHLLKYGKLQERLIVKRERTLSLYNEVKALYNEIVNTNEHI